MKKSSLFLLFIVFFTMKVYSASWYESALVGMEVGPTGAQWGFSAPDDERYCSKMDGAMIVRMCKDAGCDYVVLWARDGDYAYYNSKILPKAPGLKDRDPLKDGVEEAKKYNMPVIAYCVVQQGGHFIDTHPEFLMRDLQGNPIYHRYCYNSGYLEVMKKIIDEILTYGVQGFHIDMLDQGFGPPYGCACDICKKLFRERYGIEIPDKPTWDERWEKFLKFRYETSAMFEKAIYAFIKQKGPEISVDFNYHGNPPFSFEVGQLPVLHGVNGDFITGETGVWGFSALTVGLNAEFYRAVVQDRQRVQVAIQRGVRMYHDQTTRPLNDIRWELFTLLSHGAFVTMVDKLGFDGFPDRVAYNRIQCAFKEAHEKSGYFFHKPYYEVGIYFSSKTRDWVGRENPHIYFASFLGAHKAMVYHHIPWGILVDENVTLEEMRKFAVIIFPNVGILSNKEIDLVEKYVEEGGCVIFTGLSGCYDNYGNISDYKLEHLTGCQFVSKLDSEDNWISLDISAHSEEVRLAQNIEHCETSFLEGEKVKSTAFLVFGPAGIFKPITAKPLGKLWKPYRTKRQLEGKEGVALPMSPEVEVGPGIFINKLGKGSVLTFVCSPDFALSSEYSLPECRKLLTNAVRLLNPTPKIKIFAPTFVETVVLCHPDKPGYIIHAIAYASAPQTIPPRNRPYILPSLVEDIPTYTLEVTTELPMESVQVHKSSTVYKFVAENSVLLQSSDLHLITEILLKK
ncbi:MAG: beta-galactosidase trimerization domain-containing protein [Candidatus Hydrogenedentes bacterium]|nr:beta-galactosidase trimerization domain-containing protein [Candidatus Hydrogenedentota bacterium]